MVISTTKRGAGAAASKAFAAMLMVTTALGASAVVATPALAQQARSYDIPAGALADVLNQYARQAGVELAYRAELTGGVASPGLKGSYGPAEGLSRLLAGTGLTFRQTGPRAFTIEAAPQSTDGAVQLGPVRVEGEAGARGHTSPPQAEIGNTPPAYAGGQVATGSRVGLLGNKDFMETPFSTQSYTDEFVRNREAQDIAAVIGATDPSVYVPSKRAIFETFFVRGFNTTADDVTFNGLVGMAPNMRTSSEFAERVELLKGPSALLNGMPPGGSVAGSVNIVPKRASDDPLARLTTTFESDSIWGIQADVGMRFGENKEWGVRVNGVYRDGDTAVEDQRDKMELASLGLDYRGRRVRLSADLYRQKQVLDGVNYFGISVANTITENLPPRKGDYSLAPPWAFTINETEAVILRGEVDLTDTVTAYAAWGYREGGYDALITRNTLTNNAGAINSTAIRSLRDGKQRSGEIGLRARFSTGGIGHALSLSANRYTSNNRFNDRQFPNHALTNYYDLNFGAAPNLSTYDRSGRTSGIEAKLRSFAIADTISFASDRVQLTLGVRHQNVQSYNSNALGVRTSSYDESKTTPAVALLIKANSRISVYANYIEGLSQGQTAPLTAANAGEVLAPFQTKQYEIGAKLDLGSFATMISLFQIERPSAYTDPDTLIFATYGQQRNRGVEWNFFGEIRPGLRLLGGASYTEAELTQALNGVNVGNQVTGVPKVIAKLGVEYDVAAAPGLTLTGNLTHAGKRYVTNDNRLSLPDYTIFDLGVRYTAQVASTPVTLRATVRNVANKAYWLGSWNGGDGSGLSGGLGSPRTVLLSASVDF